MFDLTQTSDRSLSDDGAAKLRDGDVMKLTIVRLELARTEGFPAGSHHHGYEFVAPLTEDGHIDVEAWRVNRDKCTVRRFWENQPDEIGHLSHVGKGWRFDYRAGDSSDDEPFFKLDQHPLAIGLYVSVTEHDGVQRPFKVVAMVPARAKVADPVSKSR